MSQPVVPVDGFASVADYELRTGTVVPDEQRNTIQTQLNDYSALVRLYLGTCAQAVENAYPDVLCALVCNHHWRIAAIPAGIQSESVGATSVSFDTEAVGMTLLPNETELLDTLMDAACGDDGRTWGVGQVGLANGDEDTDTRWMRDVDLWVLTGWWRK